MNIKHAIQKYIWRIKENYYRAKNSDIRYSHVLRNVKISDYARAYCELNTGGYPLGITDANVLRILANERSDQRLHLSLDLMNYIQSVIGEKETSRYWNTQYEKSKSMTNEEFEEWWSIRNTPAIWSWYERKCAPTPHSK